MVLLSLTGAISALILVSPQAELAAPGCSLEGTLLVEGPEGTDQVPEFAEVYVNTRNLGAEQPAQRHEMLQREKQFVPQVLVIQAGDTVDFRNADFVPHEVHAKRDVNLFDVKKENSRALTYSKLFLEAGTSIIGCALHSNMSATILTLPSAFHARVDARGNWKISGLPKRELEVVFWESGGRSVKKKLTPCVSSPVQVTLPPLAKPRMKRRGYQYGIQ